MVGKCQNIRIMKRLKTCPFCLHEACWAARRSFFGVLFCIECEWCGAKTRTFKRKKDAIRQWNLRGESLIEQLRKDSIYTIRCPICGGYPHRWFFDDLSPSRIFRWLIWMLQRLLERLQYKANCKATKKENKP